MKSSKTILYVFLSILFFSCDNEMTDDLSMEESLEAMIIGEWAITDFSSENAILTTISMDNKSAIDVKNSGSDYNFKLIFKKDPKRLSANGDFSITMTGEQGNQPFSNTFKCTDFLNDLLTGKWGIINSNLYLSEDQLHATVLIQDLTSDILKLRIIVDKQINQDGLQANLNSTFCLTFARKTE